MDDKNTILELYKITMESKDRFIERSFSTNKFYLLLTLGLFFSIVVIKMFAVHYSQLYCLIMSTCGVLISILWWLNQDSYNVLIKLKYSKVLEVIEEAFQFRPNRLEYEGLNDFRKSKKQFVFSDIQKALSSFMFFMFIIYFLKSFIPVFFAFFKISLI